MSFTKDPFETQPSSSAQKNLSFGPSTSSNHNNTDNMDFGALNLSPWYSHSGTTNSTNIIASDKLTTNAFLENLEPIGARGSLHLDDSNTSECYRVTIYCFFKYVINVISQLWITLVVAYWDSDCDLCVF